jgi:Zn-finger nucleic acid-binding protein
MGSDGLACTGCGGNLVIGQVQGFRQYVCSDCGGVVIGIAVLRQLSGEAGRHIWTAEPSADATAGAASCPFCATKMTRKALPTGNAATCRACEVVWLDKQAAGSLPVRASDPQSQPTLETQSEAARCRQCGAPVLHTWDERCQYCGAALHAPTQVVVLHDGAGGTPGIETWDGSGNGRKGLFKEVMGILSRPVD